MTEHPGLPFVTSRNHRCFRGVCFISCFICFVSRMCLKIFYRTAWALIKLPSEDWNHHEKFIPTHELVSCVKYVDNGYMILMVVGGCIGLALQWLRNTNTFCTSDVIFRISLRWNYWKRTNGFILEELVMCELDKQIHFCCNWMWPWRS